MKKSKGITIGSFRRKPKLDKSGSQMLDSEGKVVYKQQLTFKSNIKLYAVDKNGQERLINLHPQYRTAPGFKSAERLETLLANNIINDTEYTDQLNRIAEKGQLFDFVVFEDNE